MRRLIPILLLAACGAPTGAGTGTGVGGGLPPAGLQPGEASPLLLSAHLVTPDEVIPDGQVLFVRDRIVCAGPDCEQGRFASVAATAPRIGPVSERLVAFPGLLDIHNHVSWNTWPRARLAQDCWDSRYDWQADPSYRAFRDQHTDLVSEAYCEATRYGEIRALLGGATMTQGASRDESCINGVVRNADNYNGGLGGDHVESRISRVGGMDDEDAAYLKGRMGSARTRAWLVHAGEGIDEGARREFDTLDKELGLIRAETVIIHGTGFGSAEFQRMAQVGASLTFSPLSNAMYYGRPTAAPLARDAGVNISLAPDWSPSGGQNLLQELAWYANYDVQVQGSAFTDVELVRMVTTNPARALGLNQQLGRLARNYRADILVLRCDKPDPYQCLLEYRPETVAMVAIGGAIRYADADLVSHIIDPSCESVAVCGRNKVLCVKDPEGGYDQSYASIVDTLSAIHPGLAEPIDCGPALPVPYCQR